MRILILFFVFLLQFTPLHAAPTQAIVTMSAGGGLDLSFRHFENYLIKKGIPLVFIFKPGADSLIGSQQLAMSRADGTVIGFTTISALSTVTKTNKLSFEYVSATRHYTPVLVASQQIDITTFDELVEKLNKGAVYSFGSGTPAHLAAINQLLSKVPNHKEQIIVPYKGASPVVNDLIAGHINFSILPGTLVKDFVSAGKLKVLASASLIEEYPNITILEKRYKGWVDIGGYCIILPQGTDPKIVEFWRETVRQYLSDPQVQADFKREWSAPYPYGPAFLVDFIQTIP